jgi:hypothetical protein
VYEDFPFFFFQCNLLLFIKKKLNSPISIAHAENGCLAIQDSAKWKGLSPASVDVGFLWWGFLKPMPS